MASAMFQVTDKKSNVALFAKQKGKIWGFGENAVYLTSSSTLSATLVISALKSRGKKKINHLYILNKFVSSAV